MSGALLDYYVNVQLLYSIFPQRNTIVAKVVPRTQGACRVCDNSFPFRDLAKMLVVRMRASRLVRRRIDTRMLVDHVLGVGM
jgi:hypothetical protein